MADCGQIWSWFTVVRILPFRTAQEDTFMSLLSTMAGGRAHHTGRAGGGTLSRLINEGFFLALMD